MIIPYLQVGGLDPLRNQMAWNISLNGEVFALNLAHIILHFSLSLDKW